MPSISTRRRSSPPGCRGHLLDEGLGGVTPCDGNDIRQPDLAECLYQQIGVLGGVVGPRDGDSFDVVPVGGGDTVGSEYRVDDMFCDSGTFDSATAIDIKDVLIDEIAAPPPDPSTRTKRTLSTVSAIPSTTSITTDSLSHVSVSGGA